MQTAAALLAGGITFFAGFCLGLYPPVRPKRVRVKQESSAEQSKFFDKFLNYNGSLTP